MKSSLIFDFLMGKNCVVETREDIPIAVGTALYNTLKLINHTCIISRSTLHAIVAF